MNEIEQLRTEILKKIKKIKLIGIVTLSLEIIIMLCIILFTRGEFKFALMISILTVLLFSIAFIFFSQSSIGDSEKNKLNCIYQEKIVKSIIHEILPTAEISESKEIKLEDICKSNLTIAMNYSYKINSGNCISGIHKNVKYEIMDFSIEDRKDDFICFKGQYCVFEFNRKFNGDVQIFNKDFSESKYGDLFYPVDKKYQKYETEDIKFNQIFNIISENEKDIYYILTPSMLEKIKILQEKVIYSLLLRFENNKLYIIIDSNNELFNLDINEKIDIYKSIEIDKDEISIITNFVDILSLDNDLFKMQEGGVI